MLQNYVVYQNLGIRLVKDVSDLNLHTGQQTGFNMFKFFYPSHIRLVKILTSGCGC